MIDLQFADAFSDRADTAGIAEAETPNADKDFLLSSAIAYGPESLFESVCFDDLDHM